MKLHILLHVTASLALTLLPVSQQSENYHRRGDTFTMSSDESQKLRSACFNSPGSSCKRRVKRYLGFPKGSTMSVGGFINLILTNSITYLIFVTPVTSCFKQLEFQLTQVLLS